MVRKRKLADDNSNVVESFKRNAISALKSIRIFDASNVHRFYNRAQGLQQRSHGVCGKCGPMQALSRYENKKIKGKKKARCNRLPLYQTNVGKRSSA